ncbi:MAB_1171c family putative transporter [Streptomyces sp. NRRL F-4428]|uniref:MAB_1171c family putative transporter n=1 Tax=Streptomyces sp. NRRL F-4428 TaxID=1609137 RepID=UPI0005EBFDDD|nr:MAB_1171c family putative transporter [Streptomyces sp. NRRL F-4428]KJK46804.1 membrane protein [Streptomyces sp. NRRL F-4428]
MTGEDYYIPAAAMAISLAFKLPALRHNWRDPLLRSVVALLALAGAVFTFAAPPTIAAVNRWTGIANFSAPLVYCLITAFSASCLVLMVNWRGGPPERTKRVSRRWILGYSIVIVALIVLFALGETLEERLRDFDTFYANTPYVGHMIALYLLAHHVAAVVMVVLCWRWSLQVRGWLRIGLMIIVAGYLFNLGYDATKMTAVVARWLGHDLDDLSTYVAPPLASLGALISAMGFVVPLVCQRLSDQWQTWATYRRLGPLWQEVQISAPVGTPSVQMAWWTAGELRVIQRESDIHDGFLHLGPYFDRGLRDDAYDTARADGADEETARAVADAAMVAAAVRARSADPEGKIIGEDEETLMDTSDGPRDLLRISDALRSSPVVHAVRRQVAV